MRAGRKTWFFSACSSLSRECPRLFIKWLAAALFAIYGINSQSVAVVVTAFMLGLGVGSLVGGWLSSRFPKRGILFFAVAELGVALFGLASLRIFHWASFTRRAQISGRSFFSVCACLLVPTVLMGATFPLLVEHLVLRTNRVGASRFDSVFREYVRIRSASYLCAVLLLRNFGQSGSVSIAACVNAFVAGTAYFFARSAERERNEETPSSTKRYRQSTNATFLCDGTGRAVRFHRAWV